MDTANADQVRLWDGARGDYWVARAKRYDEGVAGYREALLTAAAIREPAHVLDIGCGTGETTRHAARQARGGGSALGVDLSSRMIELARRLAAEEGVTNATFTQADAQIHPFPEAHFDIAISRHGVMFFGDPLAAFSNIARALRPAGRLVLLTWQTQANNEWSMAIAAALAAGGEPPPPPLSGPGVLNDPEQSRELLTSAGFTDVRMQGLSEPMYFGRDTEDAVEFISGQLAARFDALDADGRSRALAELRTSVAAHETDGGVYYDSAAWLIEARRDG